MVDVGHLHSALVKVKSKLTGSGVWISFGFSEHSYVLTAKHNIEDEKFEVFDYKKRKLNSTLICSLNNMDISIIKIHEKCNNKIELCLDDFNICDKDSKCWILGYPKALIKNSIYSSIEHEGTILIKHEDIFFRINDILPQYFDRDNIEGFSGGPMFEVSNGTVYLKGIITDTFDENFSYQKIYGVKSQNIYEALPDEVKQELYCSDYLSNIVDQSCEILDDKINDYIMEGDFLNKLNCINLENLQDCEFFYLPDDRPKKTQHVSLLRNEEAIKSYIHSRIISMITDEEFSNVCLNPTKFENKKLFTIHVTDFTETHKLIAKLIRQENSLFYSDSIILIIYSNSNNDLKYVKKDRIAKVISNFSEGREPELYNNKIPINERSQLKSFLETRKNAGVKFSIINVKFLVEMIVEYIKNELYDEMYDKEMVKNKIIEAVKAYE